MIEAIFGLTVLDKGGLVIEAIFGLSVLVKGDLVIEAIFGFGIIRGLGFGMGLSSPGTLELLEADVVISFLCLATRILAGLGLTGGLTCDDALVTDSSSTLLSLSDDVFESSGGVALGTPLGGNSTGFRGGVTR